jgi:hypothetical protein
MVSMLIVFFVLVFLPIFNSIAQLKLDEKTQKQMTIANLYPLPLAFAQNLNQWYEKTK